MLQQSEFLRNLQVLSGKSTMVLTGELEEEHVVEEVKVYWKITDFNPVPHDKNYCSPSFQFLQRGIFLEIDRPQSKTSINYGINVYFRMTKDDKWSCETWGIIYTLGIKKADGSLCCVRSDRHPMSYECNMLELENFFTASALQEQESELLPSNTLTIMCKLERLSGALKLKGQNALLSNIKGLFTNKEFSDVVLQLPDKEFQAHKFILAAQSPVFAAMFRHDTSEKKTGVVKISGCDPKSFQDFLKYLYSGDSEVISDDNALQLYTLSDRYDVQDLKKFCLEYVDKNLEEDNFFNVIVMAEETGDKELYIVSQKFFDRNIREILTCDKWIDFLKDCSILANTLLLDYASKASILDIKDLKKFSLEYMPENLNKCHFFDAVIMAEETFDHKLYTAAQNFFNGNIKEILASDVWMVFLKERTILANKLLLGLLSKSYFSFSYRYL